ncbi:esterase domain protein [Mycobacterium ulcerans str. Harvey]|uniref:Esterase domain protein n=1 Tax=Mycobacterium ulcerans str. Harvey TaxID=1299332 RepID=A0ABN0RAP1_MYCUL|nr:esterase domain protein [Mycobacterium ulcerans str. Harvey]
MAFALVHNRLLTPLVATDHAGFVAIYALIRQAAAKARERGYQPVTGIGRRTRSRSRRGLSQGRSSAKNLRAGSPPSWSPESADGAVNQMAAH